MRYREFGGSTPIDREPFGGALDDFIAAPARDALSNRRSRLSGFQRRRGAMALEQLLYRCSHEHNQGEDPKNYAGESQEIQDADEEAETVSALFAKLASCYD